MLKLWQGKEKYMCKGKCMGGCVGYKIGKILLIIGGLNWGLVGLGMLLGKDLNVVNMILGSWPTVEGVVYVLVGLSAVMKIFGCCCHKCKETSASCSVENIYKNI
jgi:uncharacterized membrane protein YuzA (DUF378 family)